MNHPALRILSCLSLFTLAACASRSPRPAETASTDAPADAMMVPVDSPFTIEVIGLSRESRPIMAESAGRGPMRIYVIGCIHGDEAEGLHALDAIQLGFEASPAVTLRILHNMNPDGFTFDSRANAAGVDLNRNWPASNFQPAASRGQSPLSEPEAAAALADIAAFDPHLLVVLHSTPRGPFVNFDGPAAAREIAERFASAAQSADPRWRVVEDMGYPTPGSMGSYFGRDHNFPILTVELQRGHTAAVTESLLAGLGAMAFECTMDLRPLSQAIATPGRDDASPLYSVEPLAGPEVPAR